HRLPGGRPVRARDADAARDGLRARGERARRFRGHARSDGPRDRCRLDRRRLAGPNGSARRARGRRPPRSRRFFDEVIRRFFHSWERRLASVDTNRVVRPFEWGEDWLGLAPSADPASAMRAWVARAMADTDAFFREPRGDAFERTGDELRFPSAVVTP